jgi:SAM-dependent methyltransferase
MPMRRLVWRTCYGLLAKQVPTPDWAFMNYGYAPTVSGIKQPPMALSDEQNRLCIQLYLHAVDGTDLAGKDVLEVGSGRGGGAFFISRQLRPRTMTGLDFSQEAVRLCNRHRRAPGLTFVWGDALSMPFPDASFDAVVNIESSHCYEDMDRFLSEVHRVLRPSGQFFFADLRSRDGAQHLRDQLDSCGLTVERQLDITPNVLAALKLDSVRRLGLIEALIPRMFHRPFRAFAGIEGTLNYRRLESGAWRYISAHLIKSSPSPT